MKLYTSYFSNIDYIKQRYHNMKFVSIAGKTPDIKDVCMKYKYLAPKYEWWKIWYEMDVGETANAYYEKMYHDTVLSLITPQKVIDDMKNIVSENDDICFLCYELPGKFCHRNLVAKWFRENGIGCSEILV